MVDFFVHDIIYVDNDEEQCFKLMCYTDTGVKGEEGHVIYTIRHDLTCYFDHSQELGRVIADSRYKSFIDVVSKRPGYYYHEKDQLFFRMRMRSHRRMYWAIKNLRERFVALQAWEINIPPVTQFMIATKIKIGRWYRTPYKIQQGEINAHTLSQIVPLPERVGCPKNLVMCCFDLETSGLNYETDTIAMIGMVMVMGNEKKKNIILHLHDVHDDFQAGQETENEEDEIFYLKCHDERQMLEYFTRTLVEHNVSVVTGCNTTGFDWQMLFTRAEKLHVPASFYRMSWWFPDARVADFKAMVRGMKDLKTIDIPGLRCMDLKMIALGTFIKLGSYSLNNIARAILDGSRVSGAQKHDLHWTEVVKCAQSDCDPAFRAKVARYCIRDCYLVIWCFEQRSYLDLFYDRCSIFNITIATAMYTGLTSTLPGMMMEKMYDDNKVMNHNQVETRRMEERLALEELLNGGDGDDEDDDDGGDDERGPATVLNTLGKRGTGASSAAAKPGKKKSKKGYAGGFVIDPQSGLQRAVCICDYQSLYPSLMEKYYLCFSMLIKPGDEHKYPPNEVTAVHIDENTTFYFKVPNSIHDTVVPSLQTRLKVFRKAAKKEMKKYEPGSVEYAAYDNKQNNIKLSMNGFYGFLGTKGMAQAVAASVTALGRDAILKTADIAKTEYGCNVVYGDTDSVMIQFPNVESIMTLEQREQALEHMKTFTSRITQYWHTEVAPAHDHPVLILEPETMCNGYFHTKKKYAMLAYDTGNLHTPKKFVTKGMEPTVRAFSTVAQNTIRDFLHAVVTDQDEKCVTIVEDAIRHIRECAQHVTPETVQQFVVTGQWGQEDYATPTDAYTVAVRTRQRMLDTENGSVSGSYNLGDRVPFVHVDPLSRDVLKRHILRFRNFPGNGQHLGEREEVQPLATREWQEIVLSGTYKFRDVGGRCELVLIWSNVPSKLATPAVEDVYFDGVRVKKIDRSRGMNGSNQMYWVFELPKHSCYFTAESPDFARTLCVDYYIKEIRRPLERYITGLIQTSSHLLRSDLRAVRRLFASSVSSASTSSGGSSASTSSSSRGGSSRGNGKIGISSQMSIAKRQLGMVDYFMRGGNKKLKV